MDVFDIGGTPRTPEIARDDLRLVLIVYRCDKLELFVLHKDGPLAGEGVIGTVERINVFTESEARDFIKSLGELYPSSAGLLQTGIDSIQKYPPLIS